MGQDQDRRRLAGQRALTAGDAPIEIGPIPAALGIGAAIGGIAVLVGGRWLMAYPNLCVRCLQRLDKCKAAAVTSMNLNAAGKPEAKESRAPFSELSGLQDALLDAFGGKVEAYAGISVLLARLEAAIDPADGLAANGASTKDTVRADIERLTAARNDLRRAILQIAEKNLIFRLFGRHEAAG